MARVLVVLRIMPEDVGVQLDALKPLVEKKLGELGCKVEKCEVQEIAFGLKGLQFFVSRDEAAGGTQEIEDGLAALKDVGGVEVLDVRRAVG